jgi:hypothetical protein
MITTGGKKIPPASFFMNIKRIKKKQKTVLKILSTRVEPAFICLSGNRHRLFFTDLYYFCSQNTKTNEYKCQAGKMADSSKAAQAVGQARPNGSRVGTKSRQTGQDRQP